MKTPLSASKRRQQDLAGALDGEVGAVVGVLEPPVENQIGGEDENRRADQQQQHELEDELPLEALVDEDDLASLTIPHVRSPMLWRLAPRIHVHGTAWPIRLL